MNILVIPMEEQVKGQFNNGKILENKPIGFPQDGGKQKPYSNLFYWAHAWSNEGSLIEEHPHKGFEIMSFVLKGEIEHYDNKNDEWKLLSEGDAQIIRAGSGISHAENFKPGSHIFQIWMDPGLETTLKQTPSYDDYKSNLFPISKIDDGIKVKIYKGEGSPFKMDTPEVSINEYLCEKGTYNIELDENQIYSAYLIEGSLMINNNTLEANSFAIIKQLKNFELKSNEKSKLFV
ncbi:MAG: pirin family protein, partial [Spirochaetota bacterium]|nr:pirin family protein [Spirochaetota bacterium]